MVYCPECGSEIDDDSVHCSECGVKVGSEAGRDIGDPEGVGDYLKMAWETYTKNPVNLIIPYVVVGLVNFLIVFVGVFIMAGGAALSMGMGSTATLGLGFFAFLIFVLLATSVLAAFASGIAARVSFNEYRLIDEDLGSLFSNTASHILSLAVAGILIGIVVGIGFILLVIPGIYLGVRLSLTVSSIIVKGESPVDAMKDSWETAHGNMWTIFGVLLVYSVLNIILGFIPIVGSLISALVIAPQIPVALTYIYLINDEEDYKPKPHSMGSVR